jgi:hypothetical protein
MYVLIYQFMEKKLFTDNTSHSEKRTVDSRVNKSDLKIKAKKKQGICQVQATLFFYFFSKAFVMRQA